MKKRLLDPAELAKASHMRPGDPRLAIFREVSGLNKLQQMYETIGDLSDDAFIQALFRELDLHIEVTSEDIARVPSEGGVALVANHPYGAIDGLAMLHVLNTVRPDLKVMANFMLQQLEPLKERFIGVNPFERVKDRTSFQGMRGALAHMAGGGALGVFPAGEVSSYRTEVKGVADPAGRHP